MACGALGVKLHCLGHRSQDSLHRVMYSTLCDAWSLRELGSLREDIVEQAE